MWQDAAKESERRYTTTLEWIFVGSGPFPPGGAAGPSCNHGVLVHRKTACVAHEQDKLFPFTLMPSQIEEWGLDEIFSRRVDEHMTRGERLLIRETHWGRLAALICEDLAKLLEAKVGRLIADFGVSLVIAPSSPRRSGSSSGSTSRRVPTPIRWVRRRSSPTASSCRARPAKAATWGRA